MKIQTVKSFDLYNHFGDISVERNGKILTGPHLKGIVVSIELILSGMLRKELRNAELDYNTVLNGKVSGL